MFALNQNTSDNREAEANATIRDFHELFFNILPDAKEIEYRMQRALAMSDNSVYSVYKNLKDNRYYEQITDAGIFCQFKCDSINIDFTRYPYHCSMWGKRPSLGLLPPHSEMLRLLVNCVTALELTLLRMVSLSRTGKWWIIPIKWY
jgi:hypothetical protein